MKALVVEDDFFIALGIEKLLQLAGWEVAGLVARGEHAVQIALALDELDAIIMDIRLAGQMDGLTAARAIRSRVSTPIIFCSAHADAATRERISQIDNASLVPKPASAEALGAALDRLT